MNIIIWNCRGSGGRSTVSQLNRYLLGTRADLVFISETKCDTKRAKVRIANLPLRNSEVVPSNGRSGGLWVLWSDNVQIVILERSFYFLFVKVEHVLGSWILELVYGDPHHAVSCYIWERIIYYSRLSSSLCHW